MFLLESPHRGNSNEYTQYTIFNIKIENNPKLSQICSCGIFSKGVKYQFETAVVNDVGWLVGFGFNGPLRQYFSLYRAVSTRGRKRKERLDESKNVQTTPSRTYCKRSRSLLYCNANCRTPRHWKFTQHHRTTRPPPGGKRAISVRASEVLLYLRFFYLNLASRSMFPVSQA